jgi:hypothetical protein
MIRACVISMASTIALAACAGHGMVPSSQGALNPMPQGALTPMAPQGVMTLEDQLSPDLFTCATTPPQYQWIFKGACAKITLKPNGAQFTLGQYMSISIKGSIGFNNVKTSATVYLADATDKSDITNYKGKPFPKYNGRGTTFVYASATNQSNQAIKPKAKQGVPVLQYVITDAKGIPGHQCGAAVYAKQRNGTFKWTSLPIQAKVKGKTVTITQYSVPPNGFQLNPKTPLYFAVNCYG